MMNTVDTWIEHMNKLKEMCDAIEAREKEAKEKAMREPIDIEKPQEIEGYEILDVSYRFAYDRNHRLRMEIKDTIYNPINK